MAEPEKKESSRLSESFKRELEESGICRLYEEAAEKTIQMIEKEAQQMKRALGREVISSITGRVKSAESIQRKLLKKGFAVNTETAVLKLHDIAGVRAACFFLDDVYLLAERLKDSQALRVIREKNYIQKPKNSGYKSLHLIAEVEVEDKQGKNCVMVEIQIRTLAMDFWADLDHRLCYKREPGEKRDIRKDLQECAEIVSRVDGQMNRLLHRIS